MRKILAALAVVVIPTVWGTPAPTRVLGNPKAPVGGTLYGNLEGEPDNLNPISREDGFSLIIMGDVMEGLLFRNLETHELEPGLAEKFEVSKDHLTYTFHLRKGAEFSDGKPVTAEDVRFSIESVRDPAFKAVRRMSYYDNLARIETPDTRTVVFVMKRKYFLNLDTLSEVGYTPIVPKHIYEDPSKPLNKTMLGSGPYKIDKYETGKSIELVRNDNWWGWKSKLPYLVGAYKFERLVFRFIKEANLQIEMLKKGQLDYLERVQPDQFAQKATGAPFDTEIVKHKEENQDAERKGYYSMAMNLKNPLFQERNVRTAMAMLMDRSMMNEKFRFGLTDLAAGPTYLSNKEIADPAVKPIPFDPKHATELLQKAGWEDKEKNGVLQKTVDGKKVEFRFTLLLPVRDLEKYFTVYKEALKKAGIAMEIQVIEWGSFLSLLNEHKFDAMAINWTVGSVEQDMKQVWHSSSVVNGSNFIGYVNPEVDKLIDRAREEMNTEKRRKLWRKAYRLIAEDVPYVFMFSTRYDMYFVWKHIGMTKGTMKYGKGVPYWWRIP